ncbi:16553_t:CDS:2 [Entrophospora sp. SA101]|nr:16553_t:CDS:2 [Entrophospora sp. SA101]
MLMPRTRAEHRRFEITNEERKASFDANSNTKKVKRNVLKSAVYPR